jgi:glycosyltransferase involved in cell wall biosynthesis
LNFSNFSEYLQKDEKNNSIILFIHKNFKNSNNLYNMNNIMTTNRIICEEIIDIEINRKGNKSKYSTKFRNNIISIVIPLYNEANTIRDVLETIPNHGNYEIIVVNDGSTDNSIQQAKNVKRDDIKIVSHNKNRGYGASILTGFANAKGDIVVTLDSDGQHDPKEINKLIDPILNNEADVVIGSRYLGSCYYFIPFYTRIGEFFINLVLRALFGLNIGNNQSGFRAFRRGTLKHFKKMRNKGMGLTTEILFKSGLNKVKVKEVPIKVFPRKFGFSYVKLFKILNSILSCFFFYFIKKIFRLKDNSNSKK